MGVADKFPIGDNRLARKLRANIGGEILFDPSSRGRYATDASIYQIEPVGVVVPKTVDDVRATLEIARDAGVPVLPRGGGTSQCGQTVGHALVMDFSKFFREIRSFDPDRMRVTVQPGLVLEQLNRFLRPSGLMFPVDISTANRATIGGMTGNNSCGARSIRYGNMVHNVRSVKTLLSDGEEILFGDETDLKPSARFDDLKNHLQAVVQKHGVEISRRVPKLLRRVGGYNLDMLMATAPNLAHLMVGSEGTLGTFTEITLDLVPIPPHAALGVCHFPTLTAAMRATKHIVGLGPDTVELADRTLIQLARDVAMYRDTIETYVMGDPEALLLVEFSADDPETPKQKLAELTELMSDLGYPNQTVSVLHAQSRAAVWDFRKAGLNIMMSMKGDGKPVSFIEDCAVSLDDLPDYTERLTDLFAKHGTSGTWYAHASVGCLHVRPILNMKQPSGARAMRAMAEEAFEIVRAYKGSHSGEHGDGLVRSEFHGDMFGPDVVAAFEAVKDAFDPTGLMNPGKIVRPERMDDRALFRYPTDYNNAKPKTSLDWSPWGGMLGAVEMCNNNGACRKDSSGIMCPSYRATGDEQDVTRGRANTLRLALTGQMGSNASAQEAVSAAMKLCLSCKGCKRECPTGVDMARLKIEVARDAVARNGLSLRERLVAYLPRYAPYMTRFQSSLGRIEDSSWARRRRAGIVGFSPNKKLPKWHATPLVTTTNKLATDTDTLLFADCFTRWFEPDNGRAAERVLTNLGYKATWATDFANDKPLCCGRTFLTAGLIDEAKSEATRLLKALEPFARRGVPLVGLEPSCLLSLRDEIPALLPGALSQTISQHARTFLEFLELHDSANGSLADSFSDTGQTVAIHGHCHEKAFGLASSKAEIISKATGASASMMQSTCCGMAGAFGYEKEHEAISRQIYELDLGPAVAALDESAVLIADGFSCRHQVRELSGKQAIHSAVYLDARGDHAP